MKPAKTAVILSFSKQHSITAVDSHRKVRNIRHTRVAALMHLKRLFLDLEKAFNFLKAVRVLYTVPKTE